MYKITRSATSRSLKVSHIPNIPNSVYRNKQQQQQQQQQRFLNLLECDAKTLLKRHGISVQNFQVVKNLLDLENIKNNFKQDEYVIKAQISAGGRGLGKFDNGLQGGVQLTKDINELDGLVKKMLGNKLVTTQTPKEGLTVEKVMIAESVRITRETYFCIILDRSQNAPMIIASPNGGTDIEKLHKDKPHLIKNFRIDIEKGLTESAAREIVKCLHFYGIYKEKAIEQIGKLWSFFIESDAILLEINPLAETDLGRVIAIDAKMQFDENASFRQEEIFQMNPQLTENTKENQALKHKLNYIGLDGNIGCLVNGAGLAMATMDIIKLHGGAPANFLDVGGNVNEDQVLEAFKILASDCNIKSILVNVFGGIVNCSVIAKGILTAVKSTGLNVPLTVRLEGNNKEEGRKLLLNSGIQIKFASNLDEAAWLAVSDSSVTI